MGAYRTIQLKGKPRYEESTAGGALKPGHLLKQAVGTTDTVVVHATASGPAALIFAAEDALQGRTTDHAYALGELVPVLLPKDGDEIAARLKAGQTVVIGDLLESAGDGSLQKGTGAIVAEAREVLDLTDTGAEETLIAVRIRTGA